MARLLLHSDRLEVILSTAEKTLALRRENISIPRSSIRSATLTDDPWIWVRGIRAPGTAVPLTLAVGQWKFHGGKDFLVLKGTRPSVVIDIADEEYSRVIITTKHGMELVSKLQLDIKPVTKSPRTRKTSPQVTPKPKRAAKPKTAPDESQTDAAPLTDGAAVIAPATAAAAAKARAPKRPAAAKAPKSPKSAHAPTSPSQATTVLPGDPSSGLATKPANESPDQI